MRNIKFRAWNKERNIMCYENEDNSAGYLDGWVASDIQVINQTLNSDYVKGIYDFMEFTGLKDKNGKEIYEGDIVKIPPDYDTYGLSAGEMYQIYFSHGGFRLKPKYRSKAKGYWLEDTKDLEVIGNIYNNPELLED